MLMQALTNTKKLYTTAVVISPPQSQWAPIQAIRKQYDKAYNRWMPHINLFRCPARPKFDFLEGKTVFRVLWLPHKFDRVGSVFFPALILLCIGFIPEFSEISFEVFAGSTRSFITSNCADSDSIFPFVAPDQFPAAAAILSEALSGFTPFELKFDCFKSFAHGNSSTIWLHPDSTEKIVALQAAIVKAFPFCDDQNKKSGSGFTPHLSCGQWNTRGVEQKIKEFTDSTLSEVQPFTVTHIDLISRDGDVPFVVHYQVSLGGGFKKMDRRAVTPTTDDKNRRVFVGGVGPDLKDYDLKDLFTAAGYAVEKAAIPMGKPFGFVTFKTTADQQRAVKEGLTGFNVKPANS